jgi:hypothetical protein
MQSQSFYACPVCDQLVELMHAVTHILEEHRESGIARQIRAEVDREWAKTQWEKAR